jgi:hypothetical protein
VNKEGIYMDAITKGQRNLLLFILGVCILFFPIKYIAMGNFDDRKTINSEKDERQVYYNDLKAKDANRQQYIDDTQNYKDEYEAILAEFPSELYQENTIMYLQGIKDEYEFNFPTVSMGEETLFYTLGTGAAGDVSLDDAADTDVVAVGDVYNCYSASFPVEYAGPYQSVKDVIDYIENGDYRMTVDSIDIAFDDQTGDYTGSMTFSSYAVNGGDRTTDQVDVNVQTGKDNIFGNPTVKQITPATTDTE